MYTKQLFFGLFPANAILTGQKPHLHLYVHVFCVARLLLGAGCQRNSKAEKEAITSWILAGNQPH